jgi:hypothetical protein
LVALPGELLAAASGYAGSPLHLVDGVPEVEREFYAATTPEQLVDLAVNSGILIDADDFRALLRSGSTEFWFVGGDESTNPIAHLQRVFSV